MKKIMKIFIASVLFAAVFTACEKPVDGVKELLLSAGKTSITANGTDEIAFTVTYGGEEITDASIKATYTLLNGRSYNMTLDGYTFSTEEAGEYKFSVKHGGQTSNVLTVDAVAPVVYEIVLKADRASMTADGKDEISFSVTIDGEPSNLATITTGNTVLEGTKFTTTEAGKHSFIATYDGSKSNSVTITANKPAEELNPLILSADKMSFKADGNDRAQFVVTFNSPETGKSDVTADASILFSNGGNLEGTTLSSDEMSSFRLYATYEHDGKTLQSDPITVYASDPEFDPSKTVDKNVAFFNWTGTWCGPCYSYKAGMSRVLQDPEYAAHIIQLNFQSGTTDIIRGRGTHASLGSCEMQADGDQRFTMGAYPTALVDLTVGIVGPNENSVRSYYSTYIGNDPKTALKVTSSVQGSKISVKVRVGAREEGDYSIGIFLAEDHIIAPQAESGTQEYDHTNVARQMGVSSLFGNNIGQMAVGQTYDGEYSFDILPYYEAENLHLTIYTLYRGDRRLFSIDNTINMPIEVSADYNYAE